MAATAEVIAAFEKLSNEFKWDPKIQKWLLAADGLGATSLDDFLHAFSSSDALGQVAEGAGVENKLLATSRVRQAWISLKKATEDAESLKRKGIEDVEMDNMLMQHELEDLSAKHYNRYKMTWPQRLCQVTNSSLVCQRRWRRGCWA